MVKWKPYALGINKSSYFTLFVRQLLTLALPIAIDDHECPFFMAGLILIIGYLCCKICHWLPLLGPHLSAVLYSRTVAYPAQGGRAALP